MNKISECRKIYEQAFGEDDKEFENLLFEKCSEYIKTAEYEGKVRSMLFALPCKIFTDNGEFEAVYIYAAATDEKFRGRGYMSALISQITENADKIVFLRPANDGLIAYYKKLGFLTVDAQKNENELPKAVPLGVFSDLVKQIGFKPDNSSYTAMYHTSSPVELKQLKFVYTME